MAEIELPEAVDFLIVGGGLAGLSAGARAAQLGARVLLIEKATNVGGTSVYAGFLWTASSLDVFQAENPQGDVELGRRLITGVAPASDWLRSMGIELGQKRPVLRYGLGRKVDMSAMIARLAQQLRLSAGSGILFGAEPTRLIVENGEVRGAEIRTREGHLSIVRADAVLLATGGFPNDSELVAQHTPLGKDFLVRSNPVSDGAGLRLAAAAGAQIGRSGSGFYGHLVPSEVVFDDSVFSSLALFYSEHAVLLNRLGKRFVDETAGDHLSTIAVAEQPGGRALLIADQRVHDDYITRNYVDLTPSADKFDLCRKRNARCAVADTLEDLQYIPEDWGYSGNEVAQALADYNRQCRDGSPAPGRRFDSSPLDQPPYYLVEVRPAITFPFTGILIDASSRALDQSGQPIRGLYAAGADTGGLHHRAYVGSLSSALVFGLGAAEHAAACAEGGG